MSSEPRPTRLPADETDLAERIGKGEQAAFETLMRRYNGRLFRVARAILKDDSDAEDAVQDAYLSAYRRIAEYRGEAALGTWLTRIVINHALMRRRRDKRTPVVVPFGRDAEAPGRLEEEMPDERQESAADSIMRSQLRSMMERRIDELPATFRAVFVMREVEEMTVEETAHCLAIPPATVRTRLFRARSLLREALARDLEHVTAEVFGFAGARCDRIVAVVLARAGFPEETPSAPDGSQ
jgi:RNA polymerase sigma-70 factor (ECF subfamily)